MTTRKPPAGRPPPNRRNSAATRRIPAPLARQGPGRHRWRPPRPSLGTRHRLKPDACFPDLRKRRSALHVSSASSPGRHSRRGCCSPRDSAATTGLNDTRAVGKAGQQPTGQRSTCCSPPAGLATPSARTSSSRSARTPCFSSGAGTRTRRRGPLRGPRFDATRGFSHGIARDAQLAKLAHLAVDERRAGRGDRPARVLSRESRAASTSDRPLCGPRFAGGAGNRAMRPALRGQEGKLSRAPAIRRCLCKLRPPSTSSRPRGSTSKGVPPAVAPRSLRPRDARFAGDRFRPKGRPPAPTPASASPCTEQLRLAVAYARSDRP